MASASHGAPSSPTRGVVSAASPPRCATSQVATRAFSFKSASMDYVTRALSDKPGLKALLLDEETRNALAIGYSQHDLLQHEVVLVDLLNKVDRPPMPYLRCVIMCRPTAASVSDVSAALALRSFSEYHLVFTNLVDIAQLEAIVNAEAGGGSADPLVKSIEELYLDSTPVTDDVTIVPLTSSMFTADAAPAASCSPARPAPPLRNPVRISQWEPAWLHRACQGITSMMLTMKRRACIRYRAGSKACEKIASELGGKAQQLAVQLPDLRASDSVVLILDRMDDPLTPLLTQWTYEAMIHELLGITDGNKVVVSEEAAGSAEILDRTHLLDPVHDGFFGRHRHDDFGALCLAVRDLVESYKSLHNIDRATASLEEIKNFVARMPDAKHDSLVMTRHAAIVGMLSDAVKNRNLADISVVEQDMAVDTAVSDHSRAVQELVSNPSTDVGDALRLSMIYALKYEKHSGNVIERLKRELSQRGLPEERVRLIDRVLEYAGASHRIGDLFNVTGSTGIVKSMARLIPGFTDEVSNVLTQHTPWLKKIITHAYNGTLSTQDYPYAGPAASGPAECRNILIFMVGGVTYEEAKLVNEINARKVDNKPSTRHSNRLAKAVRSAVGGGHGAGATAADHEAAGTANGASAGTSAPATADADRDPPTAKIEARVVLGSTAIINAATFMDSIA